MEGLQGVEVIADDCVVFGFGNTQTESTGDHDKNLEAFLRRCEERNIRVNAEKVRLRMTKVPVIGHIATVDGLCVDPDKIRAITEMPPPADVASVQHLLGFT